MMVVSCAICLPHLVPSAICQRSAALSIQWFPVRVCTAMGDEETEMRTISTVRSHSKIWSVT